MSYKFHHLKMIVGIYVQMDHARSRFRNVSSFTILVCDIWKKRNKHLKTKPIKVKLRT